MKNTTLTFAVTVFIKKDNGGGRKQYFRKDVVNVLPWRYMK
ncbi:unnamed protein product [marine sediment metagenome]|uniref:Uncharacterized protein n=1 Tax=marine sediment metagenome TaxID=412755 RepID=X1H1D6_9ZZZZ